MRLGTLLLRDAIISLTQLEQALRAQVLSGGRLGTNLVELGFIDLNTLGRYLARALDMPLAIADRFEKADPKYIDMLGAELADRHSALPLGIERNDPEAIGVVMSNPFDRRSVATLEERLGMRIQPYVAAELRLFYYLERYYGIRRRTRYTRSAKANEGSRPPESRRERRSTQPFRGLGAHGPVSISPRKQRKSTNSETTDLLPEPVASLAVTVDAMLAATTREQIADAILRFTIGRFACAALFLVRDQYAFGWLARAPGLGAGGLDRLNIPLDGASIFQAAHDSGKPYRGPTLAPGHVHESELWSYFAIEYEPTDLHLVPIKVADRVVNLLYAHSLPGMKASDEDASGLVLLGKQAEAAYEGLIRKAQEG